MCIRQKLLIFFIETELLNKEIVKRFVTRCYQNGIDYNNSLIKFLLHLNRLLRAFKIW